MVHISREMHKQCFKHYPTHTMYSNVSCQKLFFPARVEMYCMLYMLFISTVHNACSLGTESVFLKLRVFLSFVTRGRNANLTHR